MSQPTEPCQAARKAVVFDLDGTLLDTLTDLWASVSYALAQYALPLRSVCEVRQFLGNGARQLVHLSMPDKNRIGTEEGKLSEELEEKVFATFRTHYKVHSLDSTRPYPGIMEMLTACRQLGWKTAIVSNKPDTVVQDLHRRFFADQIDLAIGEQQPAVRRKPFPDMLELALRRLDIDASHAVYVGDSEVDLQTARNAHVPCLAVAWGFRDADWLEQQGATTILSKPEEIVKALQIMQKN